MGAGSVPWVPRSGQARCMDRIEAPARSQRHLMSLAGTHRITRQRARRAGSAGRAGRVSRTGRVGRDHLSALAQYRVHGLRAGPRCRRPRARWSAGGDPAPAGLRWWRPRARWCAGDDAVLAVDQGEMARQIGQKCGHSSLIDEAGPASPPTRPDRRARPPGRCAARPPDRPTRPPGEPTHRPAGPATRPDRRARPPGRCAARPPDRPTRPPGEPARRAGPPARPAPPWPGSVR
jgi:hypothetical protein